MSRLSVLVFALTMFGAATAYAQAPEAPESRKEIEAPRQAVSMLREYRGLKLSLNREDVKSVMGKASQTGSEWEEFKLGGGDLMTVHYDTNGSVRAIQLYFTDSSRAPSWIEVIGDAQIQENPTGSKFARVVNEEEKFWVTMFQSKGADVTTITISR